MKLAIGSYDLNSEGDYVNIKVSIVDLLTGDTLSVLPENHGPVTWLIWFTSDELFSSSLGGSIRRWRIATNELVSTYSQPDTPVTTISLNNNGTLLASVGWDNAVTIWDISTGDISHRIELGNAFIAGGNNSLSWVGWSPLNNQLVSTNWNGEIYVWNTADFSLDQLIQTNLGTLSAGSWSPDGSLLAVSGENPIIQIRDLASRELIRSLSGHTHEINALSWSQDGNFLASGSNDGTIKIWNAHNGLGLQTIQAQQQVYTVAWSPDNKLAFGGDNSGDQDSLINIHALP